MSTNREKSLTLSRRELLKTVGIGAASLALSPALSAEALAAQPHPNSRYLIEPSPQSFKAVSCPTPNYQFASPNAILTSRTDQCIAPGLVLSTAETYDAKGWLRAHVLTANLGESRLVPKVVAENVTEVHPLSYLADSSDAVAAVNGEYFDINQTNAPIGSMVQNGVPLKGYSAPATTPAGDRIAPQTVASVGMDRLARLTNVFVEGFVRIGSVSLPIAALNSTGAASTSSAGTGVLLFTPEWGPGELIYLDDGSRAVEVFVSNGRVSSVSNGITTSPVPSDGFVAIGRGSAADKLAGVKEADEAKLSYKLKLGSPSEISVALTGHNYLVTNGQIPPSLMDSDTPLEPRSAIGWMNGGKMLLLVTIDGKANFSSRAGYPGRGQAAAKIRSRERSAARWRRLVRHGGAYAGRP